RRHVDREPNRVGAHDRLRQRGEDNGLAHAGTAANALHQVSQSAGEIWSAKVGAPPGRKEGLMSEFCAPTAAAPPPPPANSRCTVMVTSPEKTSTSTVTVRVASPTTFFAPPSSTYEKAR